MRRALLASTLVSLLSLSAAQNAGSPGTPPTGSSVVVSSSQATGSVAGGSVAVVDPSGWRKPALAASVAERTAAASGALKEAADALAGADQFTSYGGKTYLAFANTFAAMAELDALAATAANKDALKGYLGKTEGVRAGFQDNHVSDILQDWNFLDSLAFSSSRSPTDSHTATLPSRPTPPTPTPFFSNTPSIHCNGASLAGGTFATTTATDPTVSATATAYFSLLSALLYESTKNTTYLDAATTSLAFIRTQLLALSNNTNPAGLVQLIAKV
ncbi:Glycoside hydrolase family 76 protein [Mycena indigotica]|uniref:Glycoside hydrolase family 76 protein n=1 Tax=Mycena indigotica TaxID=2126181 RepID=A0A8H6SP39_9AGAR|nr:Glycoside hydrolase family 76 protein [Mycena indigotica]KAF7303410.1 Glycoside hydrolase family 76 protein [Mycena indigotica]